MPWTVARSNRAEKSLRAIPASDRRRIAAAVDGMGLNPLQGDVVKLKGMDALRRRVGDYRIIFELDLKARSVRILDIARRTTATYR